jgi:hypothetical protein
MGGAKGEEHPDPLGKRALYGAPAAAADRASPLVLPVGKRALYSAAHPQRVPVAGRGSFTVRCQRCRQTSHVGFLDLLIFQFPVGVWLPRGKFDRRMTCPSCRKRSWCSVTLRGD